ncbi:hypothetical protein OG874_13845 [Nocardia sp. NBC_00565]|uniref:hypothetical protein n=1 Tax=Nocardia sp. NBC_00565 TaxID=2975993 RepID=UPI002E816A1D|nr:hypothetical protein [Nocardia sp. NBC_00565]WUC06149.1 hypothetical protein OG874_13845 [Nocardia sp. NBC_00565]
MTTTDQPAGQTSMVSTLLVTPSTPTGHDFNPRFTENIILRVLAGYLDRHDIDEFNEAPRRIPSHTRVVEPTLELASSGAAQVPVR